MSQPIRKEIKKSGFKQTKNKLVCKKKKHHKQEFGTSKLEEKFAKNFLDKLGVDYVYQFKAESIGRYYDFYIPCANIIIEIDGDYYHSYNLVYEEMSPMQKKNKRVDEQKNHWAAANGIYLLRIWEHDINDHPEKIMQLLEKEFGVNKEKRNKEIIKKQRH